MTTKEKILIISGSLNKNGHLNKLLKRAKKVLEKKFNVAFVQLPNNRAKKYLLSAKGVIFASPVHWFNVSVPMKNFIDSLTEFADEPYKLEGKVAIFLATCNEDGGQQAINSMMIPLNYMGVLIPPFASLIHNLSMEKHGQDGWQNDIESWAKQLTYNL